MKRQLAITEDIRKQSLLSIGSYRQQLIEEFTCRFGAQGKEMNLTRRREAEASGAVGSDYIYSFPLNQADLIRKELLSNGFAPKRNYTEEGVCIHYNSVLGAYLKQTKTEIKLSIFVKS